MNNLNVPQHLIPYLNKGMVLELIQDIQNHPEKPYRSGLGKSNGFTYS